MKTMKKVKNIKKLAKIQLKKSVIATILLAVLVTFNFPHMVFSQVLPNIGQDVIGPKAEVTMKSYYKGPELPNVSGRAAKSTMYITVTSYNSEPGQTDDTPFTTAFNTQVRDGIVATNFLPKGTLVRFPDLYGDKIFTVEDRMNQRYYYHMDIWMANKQEAKQFGVKYQKMEIL